MEQGGELGRDRQERSPALLMAGFWWRIRLLPRHVGRLAEALGFGRASLGRESFTVCEAALPVSQTLISSNVLRRDGEPTVQSGWTRPKLLCLASAGNGVDKLKYFCHR